MLDSEIKINQFLMQYAAMLTGDVADERWAEQPVAGVNHPAWIVGHLIYSADMVPFLLGGQKTLAKDWIAKFGPGSKLTSLRSDYPSGAELMASLVQTFSRARQAAAEATAESLARPTQNPRMKDALPTAKDVVAFLLSGHFGVHLGQLSMWRRMIGLPPLF